MGWFVDHENYPKVVQDNAEVLQKKLGSTKHLSNKCKSKMFVYRNASFDKICYVFVFFIAILSSLRSGQVRRGPGGGSSRRPRGWQSRGPGTAAMKVVQCRKVIPRLINICRILCKRVCPKQIDFHFQAQQIRGIALASESFRGAGHTYNFAIV